MAISGKLPANKSVKSLNREMITGPIVPAIAHSFALAEVLSRFAIVAEIDDLTTILPGNRATLGWRRGNPQV
jgi:hypothetical protein